MQAIAKEEPAILDVGTVTRDMIADMQRRLREYKNLHRTTTSNTETMAQVLDNQNVARGRAVRAGDPGEETGA